MIDFLRENWVNIQVYSFVVGLVLIASLLIFGLIVKRKERKERKKIEKNFWFDKEGNAYFKGVVTAGCGENKKRIK